MGEGKGKGKEPLGICMTLPFLHFNIFWFQLLEVGVFRIIFIIRVTTNQGQDKSVQKFANLLW